MMDVGVPIDGGDGRTDRSFEFGTSYHSPGFSARTSGAPSAPSQAASGMSATSDANASQIAGRRLVVVACSRSCEPWLTG